MDTVRLGKRNPLEMLYLNRKFVCPAETAHDVGKVDGGEESEQVKDDNPLLPGSSTVATVCGVLLYVGLSPF